MAEVIEILVAWAVTMGAIAAVVRFDERRLRGERLARAWPRSTFMSAILFVFLAGPLPAAVIGLVAHFVRTRRSVPGALLGLGLAVLVFALAVGAMLVVELAFGEDPLAS